MRLTPLALVTALLVVAGCSPNESSELLVPTGIRPVPAVPTGGLTGVVVFDSVTYVGLGTPPFPPARVQLLYNSAVVAETTTTSLDRVFRFNRLRPGDYGLVVRSHAFSPRSFGPYRVVDQVRDVGDFALVANTSDSLASQVFVMGTAPGFDTDAAQSFLTYCDAISVGQWTYPNLLFVGLEVPVPAGTHRFKFVSDPSLSPSNMRGWGGDGSVTLTAPVTAAPARYGIGPASDLVVNFPVSGIYEFRFDERRLTVDIRLAPQALSAPRLVAASPRVPQPLPRRLP
jgi:hypothetical protein